MDTNKLPEPTPNLQRPYTTFTKLELASLMIAQGVAAKGWALDRTDQFVQIVSIAKAVLEEANK